MAESGNIKKMKIDKLIKFSRKMETGKFGFDLESGNATGHLVKFSSGIMRLRLVNGVNIRYKRDFIIFNFTT